MPKLGKDALEKRFTCQYCGQSLRTRQGLSGHIQFKHVPKQQELAHMDDESIVHRAKKWARMAKSAGVSTAVSDHQARILVRWIEVKAACDYLGIRLSNQDFKQYVLFSLALMYKMGDMEEALTAEIKQLR